jgi:glycosyltransferase involved in cell wall biosynthesis
MVMPVYNEAASLPSVITKWCAEFERLGISYRLDAYNDGSKDDSLSVLKSLAENNPNLRVVDKPNSGHGPTILKGYRDASASSDWIFQLDSDDEISVDEFESFWSQRDNYDFLIGIRHTRQNDLIRLFISMIARTAISVLFGSGVRDVNCPYRLMRTSRFKSCYDRLPDDMFAPNVAVSGFAIREKMRIFQSEVQYSFRQQGTVSIGSTKMLNKAALSFVQLLGFLFKR